MADEEGVEEYKTSLEDLTVNSKPLINALTMLAEDNMAHAADIVQAIESRIRKAPSNQKLPPLYLIDSILKNVQKGEYRQLFGKIIVNVFVEVFQKVDEKVRQAMFKLRQTWNELFPSQRLYVLDYKVNQVDPAWPITAPAPSPDAATSIHVNPRFIKGESESEAARQAKEDQKRKEEHARQQAALLLKQQAAREATRRRQEEIRRREEERIRREFEEAERQRRLKEEEQARMKEELLQKQQELMLLEQQRLELQLAEAKAKLEAQQQLLRQAESKPSPQPTIPSAIVSRDPRLRRVEAAPSPPQQQTAVVHPTPVTGKPEVKPNTPKKADRKVREDRERKHREGENRNEVESRRERTTRPGRRTKEPSPTPKAVSTERHRNPQGSKRRNYRLHRDSESDEEGRSRSPRKKSPREEGERQKSEGKTPKKRSASPVERKVDGRSTLKEPTPPKEAKDRPPAKKAKKTSEAEKSGLSDDLAELFGKEDKDYRRLPPIPKLTAKQPDGSSSQNPRSTQWDRFKADRPEEFPHDRPRGEFKTPLLSHPTGSHSFGFKRRDSLSGDVENLSIPKALRIDQAAGLMQEAEQQRQSGKITEEKYREISHQLNELYRIQKEHATRPDVPPSQDEDFRRRGPQRGYDRFRGPGRTAQVDIPQYDQSKFYVPEYDERWSARVQEMQGRLPGSHSLVLNNTQFDLKPDCPRRIKLHGMELTATIVSSTREVLLQLHRGSKPECYYCLGDAPRPVHLFGREYRIFVLGPMKRFWIDNHQFEVKADSPPLKIWLDNEEHHVRICSFTQRLFVDEHDLCPFDTPEPQSVKIAFKPFQVSFRPPMREILIDRQLRKLDLGAIFPVIIMENDVLHGIRFEGEGHHIIIDDNKIWVPFDRPVWKKIGSFRPRLIAFGGPCHEVIIDNQWFEVKFGGQEKSVQIGLNTVRIRLEGPAPGVKILGKVISPNEARRMVGWPPVTDFSWSDSPRPMGNFAGQGMGPPRPMGPRFQNAPRMNFEGRPPWNDERMRGPSMGPRGPPPRPMVFNDRPMRPQQGPSPPQGFPNNVPVSNSGPRFPPPMSNQEVPRPPLPPIFAQSSINSQMDVNNLFSKLLEVGLIRKAESEAGKEKPASPEKTEAEKVKAEASDEAKEEVKEAEKTPVEDAPDISGFDTDLLKKKYSSFVDDLYSGFQCSSCGQRFTPGETERYSEHLDWHFRQNKKEKDMNKVAKYRCWYYSVLDWIQYEEFTSKEDRAHSEVFDKLASAEGLAGPQSGFTGLPGQGDVLSCPVASGDSEDVCDICRESFEQFWDEDEEEWHLKDAIRVNGKTYHPVCYQDAKENSKLEETTPEPQEETIPDPIKDPVAYIQSLAKMGALKTPQDSPAAKVIPKKEVKTGPKTPPVSADESSLDGASFVQKSKVKVESPKAANAIASPVTVKPELLSTGLQNHVELPSISPSKSPQPIVIQPLDVSVKPEPGLKEPGTPTLDEPPQMEAPAEKRKSSIDEPGTPLQDEPVF